MKHTVIGDYHKLPLWGFKTKLLDRRSEKEEEGYIVIVANDEYDTEVAAREIEERYAEIGYSVLEANFDKEKEWAFDALSIFGIKGSKREYKKNTPKRQVGLTIGEDEIEAAKGELED